MIKPKNLLQHNISLKDKNWFNTGGPARLYCAPTNASEMRWAVDYAQKHNEPMFILGSGANILISDDGFDGLVIHPQLQTISICDSDTTTNEILVTAGAGVSMHNLIDWCLERTILGLEEFSGIPGTVGGSVYINLHYFQFLLEHFLTHACVLDTKTHETLNVDNTWFQFGYNKSKLQNKQHILVDATFKLQKATDTQTAYARGRRIEIIRHRTARYPSINTCGSFFRNFHEDEVTLTSNGKKMIYIAYYLDKIGVKGQLKKGDAIVSYQHANMLVNQGNATSSDIVQLAQTMQNLVHKQFGIIPQPECQLVGFKKNPLF